MKKFTWKELLESMEREFTIEDIAEIKKAIIAYDLGEHNKDLIEEIYSFYMDEDYIHSFINGHLVDYWSDAYDCPDCGMLVEEPHTYCENCKKEYENED